MRRRCPRRRQARLRLHHRCGKDRPLSMAFGVRFGADAAEGTESFGCACPYRKRRFHFSGTCAKACCRSSVVEHSLGKGEVDSSILSGSTISSALVSSGKHYLKLHDNRHHARRDCDVLARGRP